MSEKPTIKALNNLPTVNNCYDMTIMAKRSEGKSARSLMATQKVAKILKENDSYNMTIIGDRGLGKSNLNLYMAHKAVDYDMNVFTNYNIGTRNGR